MSKDLGISDNVTKDINAMKNACQSLNKELSETQTKLNTLNKTKVNLSINASLAISELEKVQEQLSKTDDKGDKLKKGLGKSFDRCVKDIKEVTSEVKKAEKAMKSLNDTSAKSDSSIGSSISSGKGGKLSSALGLLDSSGAINYLTDSALEIASPRINSKYGKEKGTLINSALSDAKTGAGIGAAIGTVIAPGIGTAVGAGLGAIAGGVVGYFKGQTENFEEKDAAFKEYYSNLFDTVEQELKDSLANGSAIAAERETAANAGNTDNTYQGLVDQLDAAMDNLDAAKGVGYNETKKAGLQYQIDAYTGENSDEMAEANRLMGVYQASLENKQTQLKADALTSVMSGKVAESYVNSENEGALQQLIVEYQQAKEAYEAAKLSGDNEKMLEAEASMGNAVEAANAIGINQYNASDEAQTEANRQTALLEGIKNDSALQEEYYNTGYEMGVKLSEGLKSASKNISITVTSTSEDDGSSGNGKDQPDIVKYGKAFGLSYVPYNGYPATLHEGERVLTASENRNYGKGAASVVISGNSFVIREEADIERVARALVSKINQACTISV